MSHEARIAAAGVVEAEAVGADVAGDRPAPGGRPSRRRPRRRRARARRRSKQSLLKISRSARCSTVRAAAGPDEQHELAVGHRPQQPLDQRGAEEAGRAGDGDALAGQGLGDHGVVLAGPVYHLVDERRARSSMATGADATARADPRRRAGALRHRGATRRPRSTRWRRELGVRKQTILYCFPSKEALLDGGGRPRRRRARRGARAGARPTAAGVGRVEAVVDAVFRLGAAPARAARPAAGGRAGSARRRRPRLVDRARAARSPGPAMAPAAAPRPGLLLLAATRWSSAWPPRSRCCGPSAIEPDLRARLRRRRRAARSPSCRPRTPVSACDPVAVAAVSTQNAGVGGADRRLRWSWRSRARRTSSSISSA